MLVDTRVGSLSVEVIGDGPPVVLWPSLLTDSAMWRPQTRALSSRFRFVCIDPPGHGRSLVRTKPFTLVDCADAVTEVMDALSLPSAGFAGLSWGGFVGMRLAVRHPSRVRALALLDTSARPERRSKQAVYEVLSRFTSLAGPIDPVVSLLEPIYFSARTRRENSEALRWFRDPVLGRPREGTEAVMNAVLFQRGDWLPELSRITAPTLVVVGSEDVATPPHESERIAARIPGATLVKIPGAGHLSTIDEPEAVTAELGAFFAAQLG